jgi:hypothetical protein
MPVNAPQPWVVLLVATLVAFAWHALLALLWRIQPAFAYGLLVLVPMLGALLLALLMAWLVRCWSQAYDWSDRHLLALASGALVAHSVIGGLIFHHTVADLIGLIILGLVTILLLALFAIRIHGRDGGDISPSVETSTGKKQSYVNEEQPQALLKNKEK